MEKRESMESIVRRAYRKQGGKYGICLSGMYTLPAGKRTDFQISSACAFWDPAEVTVEEGMNLLKSGHQLAGTPQPDQFCFTASGGTADTLVKSIFGSAAHAETVDTGE